MIVASVRHSFPIYDLAVSAVATFAAVAIAVISQLPARSQNGFAQQPDSICASPSAHLVWQSFTWSAWKRVPFRTYSEVQTDRLLAVAAGVVFFVLLAIFPALTACVSIYGLFADPSTVSSHLSLVNGVVPTGAVRSPASRSRALSAMAAAR